MTLHVLCLQNRSCAYDLFAVLVHHGHSPNSGHYFAYTKSPAGTWHCMDDERTQKSGWNLVQKQQAYILFYNKRKPVMLPLLTQPASVVSVTRDNAPVERAAAPKADVVVETLDELAAVQWQAPTIPQAATAFTFAPSSTVATLSGTAASRPVSVPAATARASVPPTVTVVETVVPIVSDDRDASPVTTVAANAIPTAPAPSKAGFPMTSLTELISDSCAHRYLRQRRSSQWDVYAIAAAHGFNRPVIPLEKCLPYRIRRLDTHVRYTNRAFQKLVDAENGFDSESDNDSKDSASSLSSAASSVSTSPKASGNTNATSASEKRPRDAAAAVARAKAVVPAAKPTAVPPTSKSHKRPETITVSGARSGKFERSVLKSLPSLSAGGWANAGAWDADDDVASTAATAAAVTGAVSELPAASTPSSTENHTTAIDNGEPKRKRYAAYDPVENMSRAEWDELLDTGKIKKVKQIETEEPVDTSDRNEFQNQLDRKRETHGTRKGAFSNAERNRAGANRSSGHGGRGRSEYGSR
jgi:hypothetical protein